MDEHTEQICVCPDESVTCTSVSAQYADINIPIKAKPYASIGTVTTDCCGEPIVTVRQACGCCGCEITITQSLCIKIPVVYGTTVEVGKFEVNCKEAPGNGCTQYR